MHPAFVAELLLPSVQSPAVTLLPSYVQGLVPVLFFGSLGPLWAQVESDQVFASGTVTLNAGSFSSFVPEKLPFVGGTCSQTAFCPQPTLGTQSDLFVWLSFPLCVVRVTLQWCWPLLGLLAHCQGCGTTWDGLRARVYWRKWVCRSTQNGGDLRMLGMLS